MCLFVCFYVALKEIISRGTVQCHHVRTTVVYLIYWLSVQFYEILLSHLICSILLILHDTMAADINYCSSSSFFLNKKKNLLG